MLAQPVSVQAVFMDPWVEVRLRATAEKVAYTRHVRAVTMHSARLASSSTSLTRL